MPALAEAPTSQLSVNGTLLEAVVGSTRNALAMCQAEAHCVGASRIPQQQAGTVTGMIGVHGNASGFITANLPERFAMSAVASLMDEKVGDRLTAGVVDGVGEVANMIAGGIKSSLCNSDWAFSQITVPSVIVGEGYSIAYARGLEFLCATFEVDDPEAVLLEDRLLHISISLLKR